MKEAWINAYYDVARSSQRVIFGTSGHRGNSLEGTFQESHVAAITQAIVEYRTHVGITGPLYIGMDTHALSRCALSTALQVLGANGVWVRAQKEKYTPTPLISRAILQHKTEQADGMILTPSHNPPQDGGLKYNPPTGGPASKEVTNYIEKRANELIQHPEQIKWISYEEALTKIENFDFVTPYTENLNDIIDIEAIAQSSLKIAVDPMGGASLDVWRAIKERYDLDITIIQDKIDPLFSFIPPDYDQVIRMDCSSPYAMKPLLQYKDQYDVCIGNDPDADRHGILTKEGLLNPNEYLAAMILYLYRTRIWKNAAIGKTFVTSSLINHIAYNLGIEVIETPVGFKYFVRGLKECYIGFAGEESAGASFLQRDGQPWSTDKDGIIAGLLAAEIMAKTGKTPLEYIKQYQNQKRIYKRVEKPLSDSLKYKLSQLSADDVQQTTLADEEIIQKMTQLQNESIGGIKIVTANGWIAIRPSGTEPICKVYAESFKGEEHLSKMIEEIEQLFLS